MHRSQWLVATLALVAASLPAPAARALPLISELYYDAIGSDDGRGFVELYGTPGTSLDGLRLESINGDGGAVAVRLTLSGSFGADGLFVVADRRSDGSTDIADADLLLDFDFQNGPDSLVLLGAAGVLDAVGYGVFDTSQVFAGEGASAPDGPAGASLARRFANVDTGRQRRRLRRAGGADAGLRADRGDSRARDGRTRRVRARRPRPRRSPARAPRLIDPISAAVVAPLRPPPGAPSSAGRGARSALCALVLKRARAPDR